MNDARFVLLASMMLFTIFGAGGPTRAASPASDTADDPVYDDGWQSGDSGGFGFSGSWAFNIGSNAGAFIGSSPGIDTNGRSFGLYNEGDGTAVLAARTFDGMLDVGQVFSVDIARDPGGAQPAVWLNSVGVRRLSIEYSVFHERYEIQDDDGFRTIGPLAPIDPVTVEIVLTGADSYFLALTPFGGSTSITSGPLMGDGALTTVLLRAGGSDAQRREQFFNTLTVPEPRGAVCTWVAFAALCVLSRLRLQPA